MFVGRYLFLVFLIGFLATIQKATAQSSADLQTKVESYLNSMTLEQKVGQLFIIGFRGTKLSDGLKNSLRQLRPGAVIVFKHNISSPSQIAALNSQAQEVSVSTTSLPLLLMIDQEGGVVSRIKTRPSSPSALSIGMTQNPALAESAGFATGKILRLLGFNTNLAPVIDISDPYANNFIGNRSFGDNPHRVKVMGERFATGLERAGVLATFKHFPGHGGSVIDSHKGLPQKLISEEELLNNDLIPFSYLSQTKIPSAIMVAHIAFPNIDPEGTPATFSKIMISEVLRKKLNYSGLVITDDIEMHGAKVIPSVGERAVRALEAGSDMIMVAWTHRRQKEAFRAVLAAVKSGRIKESSLEESLRRIIITKLSHNPAAPFNKSFNLSQEELKENIELLKSTANQITQQNIDRALYDGSPLEGGLDEETPLMVFSADHFFYKSIRTVRSQKTYYYPLSRKRSPPVSVAFRKYPAGVGIFYVTGNGTARVLSDISNDLKKRLIVLNATSPGTIPNRHLFMSVIDINSRNSNAGGWLVGHLQKKSDPLRKPAEKKVSNLGATEHP